MSATEQGGVTISGLQGMGGIGKTALALKMAEQLMPRYADAQFFVGLNGTGSMPLTPAEAMKHIIRAYYPIVQLPENEAELQPLYYSVLSGKRALLLLDDARDVTQVAPLLPPASCALLVTSRQHFTLPGLRVLNLDVLPPADAHTLLLRIAPRIGEHAETIAKLCGYLPLALRLAASALAERIDISPTDFIHRLTDTTLRLRLTGVDASLDLSYNLLGEKTKALWCKLSVFPADFDRDGAAAVWAFDPDVAQDVLSELVRYSLLEWNGFRYQQHELARLFAAVRVVADDFAIAQRYHAVHYAEVLGTADELYDQGGDSIQRGLALFDLEWSNIQAGQTWAQTKSKKSRTADQLCCQYANASTVLDLRLHPQEQIKWFEAALAVPHFSDAKHGKVKHFCDLGHAYVRLGETRHAIKTYDKALAICHKIGDLDGEASLLTGLGIAYIHLGQTKKAIQLLEEALSISRNIGDRKGEYVVLHNLGNAYTRGNEKSKSLSYLQQALAAYEQFGDKKSEEAALSDIGAHYFNVQQDAENALLYFEKALRISREIGDKKNEGIQLGCIGNCYSELGEVEKASEYYQQALVVVRQIGDRNVEATTLLGYGAMYYHMGDPRHAIELLEKSLAIVQITGERYCEGRAHMVISKALDALGEREQAVEHAKMALKIAEQIEAPWGDAVKQRLAAWQETLPDKKQQGDRPD